MRPSSAFAQRGRWINDDDNVGGEGDPTHTINGVTRPIVRGSLGANVAVISDRIWREWFGGADITGRQSILVSGVARSIVGVAPPGFEPGLDVWTPFGRRRLFTREEMIEAATPPRLFFRPQTPSPLRQLTVRMFLRATSTSDEVLTLSDRLTAVVKSRPSVPEMPTGRVSLTPQVGDERLLSTGYTILLFAALVFVAACANLGNMLFARANEREGELATRLSLGATRRAIFGLLFAETVVICLVASLVGLALAMGALHLFADAVPAFQLSYWEQVRLDLSLSWRLFGWVAAAGAMAAALVGAGSLWRSSRISLAARMNAAGPAVVARTEGRTIRTMLVAVQVTAAVLLLIAIGLLLENTSKQLDRRLFFDTNPIVTARLELPPAYTVSSGAHLFEQLRDRIRAIEGVEAAAIADAVPGGDAPSPRSGLGAIAPVVDPAAIVRGVPKRLDGRWIRTSPGLFATLGLTMTIGRDFGADDPAGSDPVAIVSESVARGLWPEGHHLGQHLVCCGDPFQRTVVGVVADPVGSTGTGMALGLGDALSRQGDASLGNYVFLPAAQIDARAMLVVIRSATPRAIVQPMRQAVIALDPAVPVFDAGVAGTTQFARSSAERAVRVLAGALGAIAFAIAVFGVYAVVSYFVSRRAREFGLRLALGSTRRQIAKLVVDHAIHMILIGLLPGVLFASWGTTFFQNELVKLRPNGLTMWIVVPLLLLAAGIMAAYIPARRAARVEPNRVLKEL